MGTTYLQLVGPTYGCFGLGLALYFASQGAGRLLWPLVAGVVRLVVAAGGGWVASRWWGGGLVCRLYRHGGGLCDLCRDCGRRHPGWYLARGGASARDTARERH